eukprot:scaffold69281_cov26-Tisochrysis_lutea.AAC.2
MECFCFGAVHGRAVRRCIFTSREWASLVRRHALLGCVRHEAEQDGEKLQVRVEDANRQPACKVDLKATQDKVKHRQEADVSHVFLNGGLFALDLERPYGPGSTLAVIDSSRTTLVVSFGNRRGVPSTGCQRRTLASRCRGQKAARECPCV